MEIKLNGELKELSDDCSVSELLRELGLDGKRLAVEVNREIVPAAAQSRQTLAAGDQVEIVHAIGGGQPVPRALH